MQACELIIEKKIEIEAAANRLAAPLASRASECPAKELLIDIRTSAASVYGEPIEVLNDPLSDGRALVFQCLREFDEAGSGDRFRPQVLVLFVSPSYMETEALIPLRAGIESELRERGQNKLHVLVSAYRETIFDERLPIDGAILVCIASRVVPMRLGIS